MLLQLDAGLRQGEALGLKWGAVAWGANSGDMGRHLRIDATRPRGWGLEDEAPKTGRARDVALSRRLYFALRRLQRERFKPAPGALVLAGIEPGNFRHRDWRRTLERAGIGHRAMKDLRDTFASQLLTAGVQLGYVSAQLGHADVTVTSRHYARWCSSDGYRAPMLLREGEVPADLLARIAAEIEAEVPTQVPTLVPTSKRPRGRVSATPRPSLRFLEHETGLEPATPTLATWRSTS